MQCNNISELEVFLKTDPNEIDSLYIIDFEDKYEIVSQYRDKELIRKLQSFIANSKIGPGGSAKTYDISFYAIFNCKKKYKFELFKDELKNESYFFYVPEVGIRISFINSNDEDDILLMLFNMNKKNGERNRIF